MSASEMEGYRRAVQWCLANGILRMPSAAEQAKMDAEAKELRLQKSREAMRRLRERRGKEPKAA